MRIYVLLWTARRRDSESEEKASEEGMSKSKMTFREDYETVYKLLSQAISSKTLFVALQNAFGLLKLPEKVSFSFGRSQTEAEGPESSKSSINMQMSRIGKL